MIFSWLCFWKTQPLTPRRSPRQEATFKPTLESLEARDVPSANPLDALLGQMNPGVVPISFNFALPTGNQMTAIGQVGAIPLSAPVTLSASPGSNGAEILNLHLNPIHLDVLGLNVQTSEICLNITAQPGSGNLLGNLLFDVAHLLDTNGGNLGSALGTLGPLQSLLFDLETATLLNGALGTATPPSALAPDSQAQNLPPGATDLAHLSLGPVNLNLLGLNVNLNNCSTTNPGPVVIDVYAQSGSGELLGNLLSDVTHLLDQPGLNPIAEQQLGNIVNTVLTAV